MAVKVVQLEGLLQGKQAQLQRMGNTGQTWVQDACRLRDAVASTLAALGEGRLAAMVTLCCTQRAGPEYSQAMLLLAHWLLLLWTVLLSRYHCVVCNVRRQHNVKLIVSVWLQVHWLL